MLDEEDDSAEEEDAGEALLEEVGADASGMRPVLWPRTRRVGSPASSEGDDSEPVEAERLDKPTPPVEDESDSDEGLFHAGSSDRCLMRKCGVGSTRSVLDASSSALR